VAGERHLDPYPLLLVQTGDHHCLGVLGGQLEKPGAQALAV
jgi:hypothetical protein